MSTVNQNETSEWEGYTIEQKLSYVLSSTFKILIFIVLLYVFLLSLNFMSIGFSLVSPYAIKAGPTIKYLLSNPFAALSIGILVTALMQNATATTSIVISMVAAHIIPDVQSAIPIIMGSNLGTCVTNALISLTLTDNANEFKQAFSAATLNDMFNLLTITVLLPLEIGTHMLYYASEGLVQLISFSNPRDIASANFIAAILDPVCNLFIQLDTDAVEELLNGLPIASVSLKCCKKITSQSNSSYTQTNSTNITIIFQNLTICVEKCNYWCMPMLNSIGDGGTGLFWIILSLLTLIFCLFGIVKVFSLLIVGPIARIIRICINASLPGKLTLLTEPLLFLIALFMTLIVQSSNIVTATLVPLCGIGIVSLQRTYVVTLGSNIGTTITAILTAFTQPVSSIKKAIQLALIYTLFNTIGVILWLPIPQLRLPKLLATKLGTTVFKYRWFVFAYILSVYFIIPIIMFSISIIPNWIGLAVFGIPILCMIIVILTIKILQEKIPSILPENMRKKTALPKIFRSLEPIDKKINGLMGCCGICNKSSRVATPITEVDENESKRKKKRFQKSAFKLTKMIRVMTVMKTLIVRNSQTITNEKNGQTNQGYIEESTQV